MTRLAAAQPDEATARSYWTMGRTDSDRAFRSARRHSRHVRIMRVALLATVVVAIATSMLWSWLNPIRMIAKLPEGLPDIVVSGSTITMEQPRMSGFTRDARSYELTAASATQNISRPDLVDMRDIRAKIQMKEKATTEMTARDGIYDSKNEILKLGKNIVLTSSSGYKIWLNDAVIDIRTSNVVTEKPVEVQMLQGTLNAQRLEVKESGDLLWFDGGVKMKLNLGNNKPASPVADRKPSTVNPVRPR